MPMLMLLCSAVLPCAAAPEAPPADAGWILQKLARPAPTRTPFVELRGSAMLKAPLRIEGEYRRPDRDTLIREVRAPYAETTTLRDGQATLARAGKAPRVFALSRVPELAGLQAGFGAMLSGDHALLEKYYRLTAGGTQGQWTLQLVPIDAGMKKSVRDITLHGRGAELRCIETRPQKGELQRTLMAGAAAEAGKAATVAALAALCTGTTH